MLIIPCYAYPQAAKKLIYYVSLAGNDAWSGMLAAPGKNKTDGPFRTFERAKLEIEQLNEKGRMPAAGIQILIRGGVYSVEETITLTGRKSECTCTVEKLQRRKSAVGGRQSNKRISCAF
mgnify:CR=1 FL=1